MFPFMVDDALWCEVADEDAHLCLTVCASCEAFLTYGPDMGLVALSKREVAELLPAERTNLVRARDLVRLAKRIPDLPRPAGRAREDR
jgi:hypothetical protein